MSAMSERRPPRCSRPSRRAQFEDVGFAWLVLDDGETFVVVARVEEGARNPIPEPPEYRELQEGLTHWLAEQPGGQDLTVVGSYHLF